MSEFRRAVVLMTALVPTIGHKALIDFAVDFVGVNGYVDVIVSGRSFEPVPLEYRVAALDHHYRDQHRVFISDHLDDNAPQNPATDEEWDYWKKIVLNDGYASYEYLIASEPYGKKMAELIGAEFIPFDMDRQILPVRGTQVREELDHYFHLILPEMQKYIQKTITIFGAESTGKTTMTEFLSEFSGFHCTVPEFARPYLEMMDDKTVTDEKMATIVTGQYALQKAAKRSGSLFVVQDTDLFSTAYYFKLWNGSIPDYVIKMAHETKSDLYILMNDKIPFETDPLRYGGDKRESTTEFWEQALIENGLNYYVVKSVDIDEQQREVAAVMTKYRENWFGPIRDFVRK